MANLTYTVIKNDEQYDEYCNILEGLLSSGLDSQKTIEEYELLQLLISNWEEKHRDSSELDPVELVRSLMEDHALNQTELAAIVDYSKNYVSEILNYKKRMPKKMIRNIASHFKIRQEALNKPYRLEGERVDENEEESNLSPIYDISGNLLNYQEDKGESEYLVPSQGELELAEAK